MSAEAARMMSVMKKMCGSGGTQIMLGTVRGVSPLSVRLDDMEYNISSGLFVDQSLVSNSRSGSIRTNAESLNGTISLGSILATGDRVAVALISHSCFLIVAKVVSV